jgi:DNA-binding winged helix-turn-helix (wHTH) protein/cytochrome c-type biogenesis protein CcmH/NrfG/TolB-like protein
MPELSFQLLLTLMSAWPETLSQEEIIQRVWQGTQVQNSTLGQRIKLLRQSLEQAGYDASCVALVRGKGYRFAEDVSTTIIKQSYKQGSEPDKVVNAQLIKSSNIPYLLFTFLSLIALTSVVFWMNKHQFDDKISIAVLPLEIDNTVLGQDAYVGKGLTRELSNTLKELNHLRVIEKQQTYSTQVDNAHVKADYYLGGKVSKQKGNFVVELHLAQPDDSSELYKQTIWSQSFVVGKIDLYHLRYEIGSIIQRLLLPKDTQKFVLQVEPNLLNPTAYDLYLKAMDYAQNRNFISTQHALNLLEQAYRLAPSCAAILSGYSEVLTSSHIHNTVTTTQLNLAKSLAESLIRDYPQISIGYSLLADSELARGENEEARRLYQTALLIDSDNTDALTGITQILISNSEFDFAHKNIVLLKRLIPDSTISLVLTAKLYMQKGETEKAVDTYNTIIQVEPDNFSALTELAKISLLSHQYDKVALYYGTLKLISPYAPTVNQIGVSLNKTNSFVIQPVNSKVLYKEYQNDSTL